MRYSIPRFILLFGFIIVWPIQARSQGWCGVIPEEGMTFQKAAPYATMQELAGYRPAGTRHINLTIHIVRYANGSGGIAQNTINTAVAQLNTTYTPALIQFSVTSTDYIDDDTYAYVDNLQEAEELMAMNVQPATINVYFVPGAAGICGRAYQPGIRLIVVNGCAADGKAFPHEVGHNLFLLHTHDTNYGTERITRTDITGCTANCASAGDLLCDTPADPNLYGNVNTSCQWTGSATDPCGYTNYAPDTHNYMSYTLSSCANQFTEQQIDRMHMMLSTYPTIKPLIEVSIAMANKDANTTISGSTLQVNTTTVNSGSSINLLDGNQYPGKTNHERFTNFSGSQGTGNYKHNEWNGDKVQFRLLENFIVNRTTDLGKKRDANFVILTPATIKNELIDAPSLAVGTIDFQDPWYLGSDGTQPNQFQVNLTSPFSPTGAYNHTTGGVFLNQGGPDPTHPVPPYYSVRTAATCDINYVCT